MPEPRVAIAYDCLYPASVGGGERVYRRIADLLVERGSQVDYFTRRQWTGHPPPAGFTIVPVWDGAIYDDGGNRTMSSAVRFAAALYRGLRARRDDYDVVIASALPVLTLFAVRLAVGRRSTVVADWLEVWSWRKWRAYSGTAVGSLAFALQWLGLRATPVLTVNSAFTAERVRRYRRRARPIVLGLVDLAGQPAEPLPAAAPAYVLFAGRHIADKHIDALPAALVQARRRHPTLRLVVLGSGPETDALRAAADLAGVSDFVEIRGRVDDRDLTATFASAAVLVNPSAREGFGLVVAEAAAHGVPSVVVAGEDNAAVELIEDGVNGFVARSAGPADLGDAIARAVDGGDALRASTVEWYGRERVSRGLPASVEEILAATR